MAKDRKNYLGKRDGFFRKPIMKNIQDRCGLEGMVLGIFSLT